MRSLHLKLRSEDLWLSRRHVMPKGRSQYVTLGSGTGCLLPLVPVTDAVALFPAIKDKITSWVLKKARFILIVHIMLLKMTISSLVVTIKRHVKLNYIVNFHYVSNARKYYLTLV